MSLTDDFTDPLQAREARGHSMREALAAPGFSIEQIGYVQMRPVPINSQDAEAFNGRSRTGGHGGTSEAIQTPNIKDGFKFKVKLDPPPQKTYAADEGYPDADALPYSMNAEESVAVLSALTTAYSQSGYTGRPPKIGDKVNVLCTYSVFKKSVNLTSVTFLSINQSDITPGDLMTKRGKAISDKLTSRFDRLAAGDSSLDPVLAAQVGGEAVSTTGVAGAPKWTNTKTAGAIVPVNPTRFNMSWDNAGMFYSNGVDIFLKYASKVEGNYESVINHVNGWTSKTVGLTTGEGPHKKITEYTLKELMDTVQPKIEEVNGRGRDWNAVGRYQIVGSTFKSLMEKYVKPGNPTTYNTILNKKFNADTQNRLGVYLTIAKRPVLGNYILGFHDNASQAGQDAAKEWASIPTQYPNQNKGKDCPRTMTSEERGGRYSGKVNRSYYCNQGGNMAFGNPQAALDAMYSARKKITSIRNSSLASFFASISSTHTRTDETV